MRFLARQIDRRIAAYQRELIETHYQEVETMYRQMRAWRHENRFGQAGKDRRALCLHKGRRPWLWPDADG